MNKPVIRISFRVTLTDGSRQEFTLRIPGTIDEANAVSFAEKAMTFSESMLGFRSVVSHSLTVSES